MNQKENPNKRFADLDEKSCDELIDGAQAKRTKYATKYSISVYHGKLIKQFTLLEIHCTTKRVSCFQYHTGTNICLLVK